MRRAAAILALACAAVRADTIVLRDGTILEGAVERTVRPQSVLVWERDDGTLKQPAEWNDQLRGYRLLADRTTLAQCKTALPGTHEVKDADALRILLDRAEQAGLDPKKAESWSRKLAGLVKMKRERLEEFTVPPDHAFPDLLLDRANRTKNPNRALHLLRAALDHSPHHLNALRRLEREAHVFWDVGDKRLWLDWRLDVLSGKGSRMVPADEPQLRRARALWEKKKIHGVETPDIMLFTRLTDRDPVGRCVRLSNLTCRALEKLFETDKPARTDREPLAIYLYRDKESYVRLSVAGTIGGHTGMQLEQTLGHYSPAENISRFYWMDRPDAMRIVTKTFVHELTHHWIESRCPRFVPVRDMRSAVATPGYWIVEGFAVFMQEGRYDAERNAWSHFNGHARTLDIVADLAAKGRLLPWSRVFPLTQRQFGTTLQTKYATSVFLKWELDGLGLSEMNLFYMQAGAACHFLHHGENGAYREKLIDYVTAYYTGNAKKTDTEEAFGLDAGDLGERVVAFAKKVRAGWKPGR